MAYLISILVALIPLTILTFKILLFKEVSKNFYFLLLSNIIFSISTTSFIFYFNDQIVSLHITTIYSLFVIYNCIIYFPHYPSYLKMFEIHEVKVL